MMKYQNKYIKCSLGANIWYSQAFNGLWGSAGLKMSIHVDFYMWAILTHKAGHTDLVFGARSGFISSSVHARLKFSACYGYDMCQPRYKSYTHTHKQTVFWQPAELKRQHTIKMQGLQLLPGGLNILWHHGQQHLVVWHITTD